MHTRRPEEVVIGCPLSLSYCFETGASLNLELGWQVTVILLPMRLSTPLCSSGISVKIFIYMYFICMNVSCMYLYVLYVFLEPFGEQKRVWIPIELEL